MYQAKQWIVVLARMPSEPARHRIAVWRQLRQAGAVPVGQGAWALPDLPPTQSVIRRIQSQAAAAGGDLVILHAQGRSREDAERLEALYRTQREQEWAEFRADCDKYLAELDREVAQQKLTLAELEEEEQSAERLRRWYRDLRARDLLGTPDASAALDHLKRCVNRLEEYAELVYSAMSSPGRDERN